MSRWSPGKFGGLNGRQKVSRKTRGSELANFPLVQDSREFIPRSATSGPQPLRCGRTLSETSWIRPRDYIPRRISLRSWVDDQAIKITKRAGRTC